MNGLPLATPSLVLRHFVSEDAERIMALNAEPSTRHWLPSHVYPSLADAQDAMEYLISCYTTPGNPRRGPYVLAVEHGDSGGLLGHVGFSPLDAEVEVSYAIAEAFRGRGFGKEALVHGCRWLADTFQVARVLAVTAADNVVSRRLLERASFVHAEDTRRNFRGVEQLVSRYWWRAPNPRSG